MLFCERCLSQKKHRLALRGERFCCECRKHLLTEMNRAGYLTKIPPNKHYVGSVAYPLPLASAVIPSWWDNVIRAYEEDH
jgi:hypothetical protein